jgi:hypothetical protein
LIAVLGGLLQERGAAEPEMNAAHSGARLQSLDGTWQIAPDAHDEGVASKWYDPARFPAGAARPVQVPGNINEAWPNSAPLEQAKAANLDWYMLVFTTEIAVAPGLHQYLRFGAVRYISEVWLNGNYLGSHEGGQDPFEYDVTQQLLPGRSNTVIVRVASPSFGGLQQHVTLVSQPVVRILDAFARPDAAKKEIRLEVTLENNTGSPASIGVTAKWGDYKPSHEIGTNTVQLMAQPGQSAATLVLAVPEPRLWSFDEPNLYTIGITSRWEGAPSASAAGDDYHFRTGFRDFRIVDGYFYLNGKRVFLKSTHSNWYDPIGIMGTPRTMKYLREDVPQLKKAGFNTLRFIISAAMPEQLDEADELGLMVYSEHETSWEHFLNDPAKFGISLNQVVRRDRNHPSLVMWGLLNETHAGEMYNRAKAWLPSLRAVDDTRLILLSSGRWDGDFRTASASNPGSATWNVYLGGEDPIHPTSTGVFQDGGEPIQGSGDFHIYAHYPTSWGFITGYETLGRGTKPFFQSEMGDGSSYDAMGEKRGMERARAPATSYAWIWINPAVKGLQETWKTYDLRALYPTPEDMLVDSALSQSRQRARTFSIVRSNPKVIGFNLTSLVDCWSAGEGFMDSFRAFKPGELAVLQAGWAPLRWCLLVNPTNVYADQPLRIRVTLANEDLLPGGDYPAFLKISGPEGVVWKKVVTAHVGSEPDAPMACSVFDEDVTVPRLTEGTYTLEAELTGRPNAAASSLAFTVSRPLLAEPLGAVTALGLDAEARDFLVRAGATIHEYAEGERIDREVVLVGDSFKGRAAAWRALYARCARGAHIVFLAPKVFLTDPKASPATPVWLALGKKGALVEDDDWLYHKDVVALKGPAFDRLQTKLMTPEYYEGVLARTPHFEGMAHPDTTEAVAIRCVGLVSSKRTFNFGLGDLEYADGIMLGTYRHHAGRFTINALDILGNLGTPAADRLLVNLVKEATSDAAAVQSLPANYDAEMASLGIADGP